MTTRFYRWQKANIWQQLLERLQASADREGNLDCPVHYMEQGAVSAFGCRSSASTSAKSRRR
ncbi:hypothetical protein OSCI_1110007 [Kamptonema sp. PCC 6506]|nr:hypothetical protein OSCI_1110007 [Kamptonema sp. PCC 6506]